MPRQPIDYHGFFEVSFDPPTSVNFVVDINDNNTQSSTEHKITRNQKYFLHDIMHQIKLHKKINCNFIHNLLLTCLRYGRYNYNYSDKHEPYVMDLFEKIKIQYPEIATLILSLHKNQSHYYNLLTKKLYNFIKRVLCAGLIEFDIYKPEWRHNIPDSEIQFYKRKYKIFYSYIYKNELCKYASECQDKCPEYYQNINKLIFDRRREENIKTFYIGQSRKEAKLHKINKDYYLVYYIQPSSFNARTATSEGIPRINKKICKSSCNKKVVHRYNVKPKAKFMSLEHDINPYDFYFGIELECNSLFKNKKTILSLCKNKKFIQIVKHDGSLSRKYGVEIVTQPMTIEYYQKYFKDFLNELNKYAKVTSLCGTHMHFNKNYILIDSARHDLDYILRKNIKALEKICNRNCGNYCYMPVHKSYFGTSESKYEFINFLPKDTIEFRLLKGTLSYDKILSIVKLMKDIIDIAKGSLELNQKTEIVRTMLQKFNN